MLPGLRHDDFVRRNDEQGCIEAAHPREHVLDEVAMAGHIHDTDFFTAGKRQPAEAKLDRHLTRLFLLETIGMGPRQRGNQRGFSVVDVTGGANNAHAELLPLSSFLFPCSARKMKEERGKRSCCYGTISLPSWSPCHAP